MEIKTTSISTTGTKNTKSNSSIKNEKAPKFSEELNEVKKSKETDSKVKEEAVQEKNINENKEDSTTEVSEVEKSLEELNSVVEELNQPEEKESNKLKKPHISDDNTNKGENLINNDFTIPENKDLMGQMNPNMNFSGDGQPFSSFMNNSQQNSNGTLSQSASDLEEEAQILSTMAENIALANKNNILSKNTEKDEAVQKTTSTISIPQENIISSNSIIMNQADVEVFATIVETGSADLNNLAPETAQKSVQVSKTLADMLAKAKETSQPLRIDFDNDISIIIRISRDGKISADFLPSSQVAEAYLKENLPLLKQRFDENNIDYEELNHRERKEQQKEDTNKKKGRDNE